jgi:hypothetical protein
MYLAENGLSLYDLISSSSINFEITTTTHKVVLSKTFLGSEVFDYLTNDLVIPLTIEDFKHLKKETYKLSLKLIWPDEIYELFSETDGLLIIR